MAELSGFDWGQIWDSIAGLFRYDPANPMIFSSGLFIFVFCLFCLFYSAMRRKPVLRIVYLSLFSIYFYYKTGGFYFFLLIFASASDYFIGLGLVKESLRRWRKPLLALSLVVNLGMLAYFKYTNMFIGMVNDLRAAGDSTYRIATTVALVLAVLFGVLAVVSRKRSRRRGLLELFAAVCACVVGGYMLRHAGLGGADGILAFKNIFLPIGISFFVFQSLSYTIDIYRGELEPLRCWLDYFFYLSFFPQLVAGPIVRAREFIPQIRQNPLRVTREMFGAGVFLVMAGLIKKAIISDYISLNFVDRVFDNPMLYSGFENLLGVYGYALQIYCDFSGYSDMAIGIALLLGFRFGKNFDTPYKSATITEFWRRWHISLSSWLRDYLYISLGGNRKGKLRTYVNLIVTMLLGGLWHGAAMKFVLWGGFHGMGLAVHKFLLGRFPRLKKAGAEMSRGGRFWGIILTFNFVCLGWIFFRAADVQTGVSILSQIITDFRFALIPDVVKGYSAVMGLMLMGYLMHFMPAKVGEKVQSRITRNPMIINALILAVIIWVVMQIKSSGIQPFIYFQF